MLVQCHENTGWRMAAEVSGTEHQSQQQGAPSPAHFEVPTLLLTCFTNAAEVHPFSQFEDDSCNNMITSKKNPKLKVALLPLSFHFSSLLFLMKLNS